MAARIAIICAITHASIPMDFSNVEAEHWSCGPHAGHCLTTAGCRPQRTACVMARAAGILQFRRQCVLFGAGAVRRRARSAVFVMPCGSNGATGTLIPVIVVHDRIAKALSVVPQPKKPVAHKAEAWLSRSLRPGFCCKADSETASPTISWATSMSSET